MDINFLLFEQFETLDLFGPVEICDRHPDFQLHYISQNGGLVTSTQGVRIDTKPQRNMNTSGKKEKGLPPIKELSTGSFPHPIKSIG